MSLESEPAVGDNHGDLVKVDPYEPPSYDEVFPPLERPDEQSSGSHGPKSAAGPSYAKMAVKSSTITQVFHVPLEERRFREFDQGFGESGSHSSRVCMEIMQKTGASIEMSMAKDQSLTIVITGKSENVMQARREVTNKLQTQANVQISIPREHHRFIIGRKGEKLKELELQTATKITVPKTDEPNSDCIRIVGPKDGIERARHEIQLISEEQAKRALERLKIPYLYHPFVCGPNNIYVKDLMAQTGAQIHIPPPSAQKDEIVVSGEKDGVHAAAKRIQDIYEEKKQKTTTVSLEVRKTQHKYVIGPKGTNIAEILEQTGVSVEMPSSESQSETITLRGEQAQLGPAITLVYSKANSVVIEKLSAPPWLHRFIIGRKGKNINSITQNYPKVHVEFEESQGTINLEGPPEEVGAVKTALDGVIKELQETLDFAIIKIDPKYAKHIIGKNGANVNRIKTEYGVSIRIPSEQEKSSDVRIEGRPDGVAKAKAELMELAQRMENEKQKDIMIEYRFHRLIIGTGGDNIKAIREKFNQVQISFPSSGKKSDVVSLRGPKQDVDKCFTFLKQLATKLSEENYEDKVHIFKQFHKNIIGRGGATINKIKEETDTRIEIPTENSASDVITITGRKANVEKAKEKIAAIQNELANIVEVEVNIAAKYHQSMIGPKGSLIKSIMDDCGGVHIHFPTGKANADKVTIRGPKDEVEKAKKQLLELASEREQNSYSEELHAKPEYHKFLIGRGGANIRKVREETNARVVFPNARDEDQTLIVIIGSKAAVKEAKERLEKLIADLESVSEIEINVDMKYHRHFVARRGQILREIGDEYGGVTVSFPRSGVQSTVVKIKGAKDCVEGAKNRIQEIVADLEQQVSIDCVIPQKHHRSVMGPKGSKVQTITMEFDVGIKFPERPAPTSPNGDQPTMVNGDSTTQNGDDSPKPTDVIVITGRRENCEKAKGALLALVPVSKSIDIPFDFHRYVIGQKGQGVRKMMDTFDVNISIPPASDKSDVVIVTGTPSNVDSALEALQARVREIEDQQEDMRLKSFTIEIRVNPEYHPKIIGRKGVVVSNIRDTYDVNIQFPDRQSEDPDLITIQGYEENVNKAKEEIEKIVHNLENQFVLEEELDSRIHNRLIGYRGKAIRKVMEDYKVDIRFPRSGDPNPNLVVITGDEDSCYDCFDHLKNLEVEYLEDVSEREDMQAYMHPPTRNNNPPPQKEGPGFVVRGAPWSQPSSAPDTTNTTDFPSIGSANPVKPPSWGPRKF